MLINHLSPDLVQSVLDALPVPVFFKDRQGLYQGCNKAFTEVMGKRSDELLGMSVFDLSPPDLAQVYFDADEALMRSGGEQRYEAQIQLPSGERRDVLFYKAVLRDAQGEVTGLVGTLLDITERKALEMRLADLAQHDALTGLLNRRAILAYLDGLHKDRRQVHQPVCLMMIDVDRFKSINDQHGHAVGDEVLRKVAFCLKAQLRDSDRVGRIGGEEFLIVLGSTDLDDAQRVAERLRQEVAALTVNGSEGPLSPTVSLGLAQSHSNEEDWADVIGRADAALYEAKRAGRNRVVVAHETARSASHKDWHRD
ncbi:diguanylate cyclase [Aquabacterium sp.]|uniref:sensor domain-containing diguanylate cyclase n=1 Tax=Aquabacterium sp. TaxID=1872578 RepID=UPI002E2ED5EF|nr:diguanylate cyclase [Aquabacterium sp.]HEX5311495.1 diguanylate cyclase [Aquabacterium sp.]